MANNILSLILKDLCALWSERMMGLMFVCLLAIGAVFASYQDFPSLLFVFMTVSVYIMNVFSLEEKFRTERFMASLPVRRRDIVLARYGGILAIAAVYFVVAYLANVISILIGRPGVRLIPLGYCSTVILILGFTASFTFPFYFKFGMTKAKTVTNLLVTVLMALGVVVMTLRQGGGSNQARRTISAFLNSPFPRDLPHTLLLMCVAILLLGVSIPVAVALYSRKDL